MVDDLFLSTAEFEFDGALNEAAEFQRCTAEDLRNLLALQGSLNAQYPGSQIVTEFAFNGGGIAVEVGFFLLSFVLVDLNFCFALNGALFFTRPAAAVESLALGTAFLSLVSGWRRFCLFVLVLSCISCKAK